MAPALAAPLLAAALAAQPVSGSRLGVVVRGDDTAARELLAACPRLVVFALDAGDVAAAASQLAAYRAACSGGSAVVQVGGVGAAVNGATAAAEWPARWLPLVQSVAGPVDGVAGPLAPAGEPAALAAFWASFVQQVRGAGYLPVVDSGPGDLAPAPLADGGSEPAFCAVARAAGAAGAFALSYEAPVGATSAAEASSTSLGYRVLRDRCGLAGAPVYLVASLAGRAWAPSDLPALRFLDAQAGADADVRGVALWQAGDPLAAGSLAPIAGALAAELASPADGGAPDGGADAGPADGGDGGDGGSADGGSGGGGAVGGHGGGPGGATSTPAKVGCGCGSAGAAAGALPLVAAWAAQAARRRRGARLTA